MQRDERHETVIVGGGQAGLSVGYHLKKQGRSFVILDANERIGDSWRSRWDSLRLYSPAFRDGLPGMPFPAPRNAYPTKDEMGDYLEAYATRFELPVRSGAPVVTLARENGHYVVNTPRERLEADNVVAAAGVFNRPHTPEFAASSIRASSSFTPTITATQRSCRMGPSSSSARATRGRISPTRRRRRTMSSSRGRTQGSSRRRSRAAEGELDFACCTASGLTSSTSTRRWGARCGRTSATVAGLFCATERRI